MTSILFFIRAVEASFCSNLPPHVKRSCYAIWIWILTFLIYTSYHLSRKPISVVKNVLNENCSKLTPPHPTNDSNWCDWEPFDGENSSSLLGVLDSTYLFMYAFGMFFSGLIAERTRLNVFLCTGMVISGLTTAGFGLGYTFGIHYYWYYIIIQGVTGLFQSSGWPGVVSVMGNWFGKRRRGLIMGIWNSHTSVGNILGTLIATAFLTTRWDLSFIVPGLVITFMGIITLFFLVPKPEDVDIENPNIADCVAEDVHILPVTTRVDEPKPIGFFAALVIPGVIDFSLSLFFSKLVSYTFLYWLPHFIFDSTSSDASLSGEISTFYDLGGIAGGILAGVLSDWTAMPASTCSLMLIAAIPMIYSYQGLAVATSTMGNMLLLIPVGLLVNGPYALITTAVSAELGTSGSLNGNARALSTVTSIIDGTGSLGAAVGPLLAGVLSDGGNWSNVFYMMVLADLLSLLFLLRVVKKEMQNFINRFRIPSE